MRNTPAFRHLRNRTLRTCVIALLYACALPVQAQDPSAKTPLQDYVGQYVLADGRVLSVTARRHTLIAQLEGEDATPLQQAAPARYVGRNHALTVTFDQRPNGNVAAVTVSTSAPRERQAGR